MQDKLISSIEGEMSPIQGHLVVVIVQVLLQGDNRGVRGYTLTDTRTSLSWIIQGTSSQTTFFFQVLVEKGKSF